MKPYSDSPDGEPMDANIREMKDADGPAVLAIYADGIQTGDATFDSKPPEWSIWNQEHLPQPRLVAQISNEVVGWAALATVSGRCVYGGVAEVSVYVANSARGMGIGKRLLLELIESAEAQGIWTLQAGIFVENQASIALHKSVGFREVGVRERLGRMSYGARKDQWRDVLLMEYRSQVVGVD